ncbi:zinc ribbon domain-containing protein [Dyadobacter sp. CY312]|uniref:zinc ribbon domain-containing protein n=1 Tax=Dyadobacter sp. CY312 TaxID=2907303 RepID=UPI001F300CEF|nr:zinc ribbon domain-containing protein [Dyadobacter sp. CY312]MCE7042682.1 zinc ribbon domain-containing protein [Dyadobacter sp. CY312]
MLVCNNCGSANTDDAVACSYCRMRSGFTQQPENETQKVISETVMCVNCGNHVGADLSRCPECRFPISRNILARDFSKPDHSIFTRNLKAG